jgi:enamine deaminase RidA (YjgF/YER057c/UK114 family)
LFQVNEERNDTKQYIQPEGVAKPLQPYTPVIRAGKTVYVAGQVPLDENRNLVGKGDPGLQAEQCWKNIGICLASAGASVEDIVKVVIFFADLRHVKEEMEVRRRLFPDGRYPVASIFQAAKVGSNADVLMEIDVTAVLN